MAVKALAKSEPRPTAQYCGRRSTLDAPTSRNNGDLILDRRRARAGDSAARNCADEQGKDPIADPARAAVPSWNFASIPIFPPAREPAPRLQAKLAISTVDDPLEREADAVADTVMRMPEPAVSSAPLQVCRKCAACEGVRFGRSFGDIAVLGEQPISETSVRNETALPTSQTDAGPLTPTQRVPSPPAHPPAAPAAPQCTISSQTLDTAPDGTADTRTVVGVNEIVTMTASAPSRWSATAGSIHASGENSTWVSPASANPVSCSVTATPAKGSPCSINFQVIPPRGEKMTKTTDRVYTAGLAGSGFEAAALILPLNVSFSGIQVREETVASEAAGYYKDVLGWDKRMHPTGTWSRVDATNNNVKDLIGTDPPGTPGPFGLGFFHWSIPLTWRTPNDLKTFPYGTAEQVQLMINSSGTEMTFKQGAGRTRTP
jgi:hypothetical protein